MEKKFTLKRFLTATVCALFLSVGIYGCGAGSGLFSEGKSEFRLAKEEFSKGNELKAIDHTFNAIIIDPEVNSFKKFIHENFDNVILKENNFIKSSENTSDIAQAERRVETFKLLVSIYSKIQKVQLPLSDSKGKFEWTTTFVDYSEQEKASIIYAFNLLMKSGKDDIAASRVKEAYEKFIKAYDRYCAAENKSEMANKITDYFTSFASENQKSNHIEKLELAYMAWGYALKFTPSLSQANQERNNIANKIADLYHNEGLELLSSKNIDDNIRSVDQFNLALKWNANHVEAQNSIKKATEKIAEYYYASALKLEKKSKSEKDKIIALYRDALKWIPDYKDAMYRIYSLQVGSELITLKNNLAETRKQYNALTARIETISGAVDKSYEVMEMVTYVSDHARNLNTKMKNVESTLKALTPIPVVGTVSGVTSRSLSIAQRPVGGLVEKFDAIERPFITPTKAAVEKVKTVVDGVKGMVASTKDVLEKSEKTVANIDDCIKTLKKEDDFRKVEGAIKEVNKGLSGTADQMRSLNNSLTSFEKGAKALAVMHSPVSSIKNGFNKIKPTLDKASDVTHEMDKVLKKEFGFTGPITGKKYTMSLHKALTTGGEIASKIADLGMKAAKPVMDKMKISFPTIPGVDELKGKLDVVKNEYNNIQMQTEKIKESYDKYTDFHQIISSNLNKIVETTGCSVNVSDNIAVASN